MRMKNVLLFWGATQPPPQHREFCFIWKKKLAGEFSIVIFLLIFLIRKKLVDKNFIKLFERHALINIIASCRSGHLRATLCLENINLCNHHKCTTRSTSHNFPPVNFNLKMHFSLPTVRKRRRFAETKEDSRVEKTSYRALR